MKRGPLKRVHWQRLRRRLLSWQGVAAISAMMLGLVAVSMSFSLHHIAATPALSQSGNGDLRFPWSRPTASATPRPASPQPVSTSAPATSVLLGRLLIPKIGVDAVIERVGVDSQGRMGVPSTPWTVGWYGAGTWPGASGDAVIDGHLDWYTSGPAVFWRLGELQTNDVVVIAGPDGSRADFAVSGIASYPTGAEPAGLFTTSGAPLLSLITCSGTWDAADASYTERMVVTARFAGFESVQGARAPRSLRNPRT